MESKQCLFVYGTLMRGYTNQAALKLHKLATFISTAYITGNLYDMGEYPAAVYESDANNKVWGEVWHLSDFERVIKILDDYEGIYDPQPEYVRKQVTAITNTNQSYSCWIYLLNISPANFTLIPSGDYRLWVADRK